MKKPTRIILSATVIASTLALSSCENFVAYYGPGPNINNDVTNDATSDLIDVTIGLKF